MDLEQAKAAWAREKSEFLREKPPKERAAYIKRKAIEIDRKLKNELRIRLSLGLLCLILLAGQYDPHLPILSNVGLGMMLLFAALGLACHFILILRFRESRPELPRKEYLAEQRKMIASRIRVLRLAVAFILPPALFGLILWQATQLQSKAVIMMITNLAAITLVTGLLAVHLKIRKQLWPMIREIDQELNRSD